MLTTAKPTSLCPPIISGRMTSVFRRPARPPVSALPARASSTRFRSIRIITSPNVSTPMPALRTPTSPAVWPSPFLTAPASPITPRTTLLRQLVVASPSDALPALGLALSAGLHEHRFRNHAMHALADIDDLAHAAITHDRRQRIGLFPAHRHDRLRR